MDSLTLTLTQLELIVGAAFFGGVGVAHVCHAIIRAALTAPLTEPEPEVIVIERPPRRTAPRLPARARFATPLPILSPAQWARQSFDDPRGVRLAVQIGAGPS